MKHRDEILRLRAEGKTYDEIKEITGASKGTISFHCGKGQKEKYNQRLAKYRKTEHPLVNRINNFMNRKYIINNYYNSNLNYNILKAINNKITDFQKTKIEENEIKFTLKDVTDKFGENPKCYLTGENIDIYKPKTYQFDHIVPASKGGKNTLDNLGLCLKIANQAKGNLTLDEFYELCKKVTDFRNNLNK